MIERHVRGPLAVRLTGRRALEPLHDGPGEHVQRQVVWATGFGVGARESEAAEGLYTHQRSGDATVEVHVASLELLAGPLQVVAILRVDAAGEAVRVVVGDA